MQLELIGFLESTRPKRFRALLRRWSFSSRPRVEGMALGILLRLGDPPSGDWLVDYVEEIAAGERADLDLPYSGDLDFETALGLSPSPDVAAYLRKRDAGLLVWHAALAMTMGLSARGAQAFERAVSYVEDQSEIDAMLLAGRPFEALALGLEAYPVDESGSLFEIGHIKGDGVAAWLRGVQARRDLGLYAWATGQLSLMGDPAARAETWAVIRAGRYHWLYQLDERVLTNNGSPEMMPFWIGELRSQCCRISMGSSNLYDDLLDDSLAWFHGARRRGGMTSSEWAERRWRPSASRASRLE